MSITGGISFYDENKSLYNNGALAVASSNLSDQNLPLGTNKYFKWSSFGSNDSTTETYTITLPAAVSLSRIFLMDHNLKKFQIKYGTTPIDFTGVIGLDSYSDSKIDITDFTRNTAYFEFDAVTTDTLVLTMDTTQTANAEKFLVQFIATNEIGTLLGYPKLNNIKLDRDIKRSKSISGRSHIEKSYESGSFDLSLKRYSKQDDIDILDALHDRETPFLAWLCGGLPDQFTTKQRGFRVQDIYNMEISRAMSNAYDANVYLMGVNQKYSFQEVV